jgi:hypothetical protein
MRVAYAELVHVVQGVADVVDARPSLADSLGDQPRTAMEIELAHVGRMPGVGDESQRPDTPSATHACRDELRRIDAARHLAAP